MTNGLTGAQVDKWLENIDNTLETFERAAPMWGDAQAQEFFILELMRTRHRLLRPEDPNDYTIRTLWLRFIAAVNGEDTSWTLASILREEGMLSELPRLLCDFARWLKPMYDDPDFGGPPTAFETGRALGKLREAGLVAEKVRGPVFHILGGASVTETGDIQIRVYQDAFAIIQKPFGFKVLLAGTEHRKHEDRDVEDLDYAVKIILQAYKA